VNYTSKKEIVPREYIKIVVFDKYWAHRSSLLNIRNNN
jgi:hypothetical protein